MFLSLLSKAGFYTCVSKTIVIMMSYADVMLDIQLAVTFVKKRKNIVF